MSELSEWLALEANLLASLKIAQKKIKKMSPKERKPDPVIEAAKAKARADHFKRHARKAA